MNDSTQSLAQKAAALAAKFDMKLLWFLAVTTLLFVGEVYRVYPSFLRFIGQKLQPKRASFASDSVQQAGQCSNFGISFRKKHTQSEISFSQLPARWQAPFVVPDAKLIFCPQFKVGTTEFMRLLRWLDGQDYNVHPHFQVENRPGNLTTLENFGQKAALQMMLDSAWIKLVVVRDPLDRLRSAYLDKIKGAAKRSEHSQQKLAHALNVRIPTLSNLSFAAFVRRVEAQMKKNVFNVHWSPQAQQCGLEHFKKYYYVLHMGLDKTTHPALRDCVLRTMTGRMNKSKLSTLQHIVVSNETRSRLQAHETDSSLENIDGIYDEATCNIALRIYTEDYDFFSLPRPTCHKTSPHVRWPV